MKPERKILDPPRREDGLFAPPIDFSAEREVIESHNRDRAVTHGHYADPWTANSRTYDPKGKYNCRDCNMDEIEGKEHNCILIESTEEDDEEKDEDEEYQEHDVPIDPIASCEHWEDTCAGDTELRLNRVKASYGKPKNGIGFGCLRCSMQVKRGQPDSRGRSRACLFWDMAVLSTACCQYNDAPVVGDDDADEDDEPEKPVASAITEHIMRRRVKTNV